VVVVARRTLSFDLGTKQNLLGLRTTRRPWQVAWFLNEHFSTQFMRIPDWVSAGAAEAVPFTCYSWTSDQKLPLAYLLRNTSPLGSVSPALRDACDYLLFYSDEAPLPEAGMLSTILRQHQYFEFAMALAADDKRWSRHIPIFF
jgi:hypothetical protein